MSRISNLLTFAVAMAMFGWLGAGCESREDIDDLGDDDRRTGRPRRPLTLPRWE